MSIFEVISIVILLVAVFGYLSYRFIGLPDAIGITAVGMVGLMVGNRGKREAMSEKTRERLFGFWEVLDELLNLLLFGLIGLEMVVFHFTPLQIFLGLAAVAIVLAGRLASIAGPIFAVPRLRGVARATLPIMTWGGLRGGISIALALSLPDFPGRETVISATYVVVIFSILVQATTLGRLAARVLPEVKAAGEPEREGHALH